MAHKPPRRPTPEDMQREFERTRVQIRDVEESVQRRTPRLPPLEVEPGDAPPAPPTLH